MTLLVALVLLAGCGRVAPTTTGVAPVALQPIETDAGTLLAPADLAPAERTAWLDRLARTVASVDEADFGPLDDDWDGRLVVELPATADDYAALAGADGAEAAAVTRCADGSSSITINPRVAAEGPGYLDALLLHEAVHAATGAGCADAPLWIEEGLAEWFAAQHDPAARDANQQWLDHELAAGLPAGLPQDADFAGTAAQVSGAYALAVFAVATAVEHLGHDPAMAYFADPDEATTARIIRWHLDGLAEARPTVR